MKYVLDTHAWFWALEDPERIPRRARALLGSRANVPFGLSAISLWELAKLVERGRIRLTIPLSEWMERGLNPDIMEVIALTPEIAIDSTTLPGGFHADPADQIIVASARRHNATLITADKRIWKYPSVKTVWE